MAYTTIDDPSKYFQIATWTGSDSTDTITFGGNSDLQLDWLWTKSTSNSHSHALMDTSRITSGDYLPLFADTDDVEQTTYDSELQSILSDGFTVGTQPHAGGDGKGYIGYAWKVNGGSLTTNDASATSVGTIDSVYQANTTAGISIVTYTGTGSNGTVAHGLGSAPEVIWFKKRTNDSETWCTYFESMGNASAGKLDTNAAFETGSASLFDSTSPTSTVFSIKTSVRVNDNTDTYVAYCFKEIQGYSKFGSYTGNGAANGTFIHTGFKPAWVLFKATTGTENWGLFDNARNTTNGNPRDIYFTPSTDSANSSESDSVDFVSNGFKWRISSGFRNADGVKFVYMAFAENPFVSSTGTPGPAR